jgi:hypothetical protein
MNRNTTFTKSLIASFALLVPVGLALAGCASSTDPEETTQEGAAQEGTTQEGAVADDGDTSSTSQAAKRCHANGVTCKRSSDCCNKFCATYRDVRGHSHQACGGSFGGGGFTPHG